MSGWIPAALLVSLTMLEAVSQAPSSPASRTLARGALSGIGDSRQVVVRRAADWQRLWAEHATTGEPPAVDWDREMVVGLFMGRRMTGGFSVDILEAEVRAKALVVRYRETAPAPGDMTIQMLTSPFHLVAVPRWDGATTFEVVP